MRLALVFGLLAVAVLLSPGATADAGDQLGLVPDWPESFEEARSEPIRLLPGSPIQDQAAHGAAEPGSSSAGTSYAFHWSLQNPDGSPGPAGDLPLDTDRPLLVDVYLSAGPPNPPAPTGLPGNQTPGLAPLVTVEADLEIGDTQLASQAATHTLVSTPGEDAVQRYRFAFDVGDPVLDAGEGLDADVNVYQAQPADERLTQPGWRIHTGNQHPSGLTLPLAEDDTQSGTDPLSLQSTSEVSREDARTGAYAALVASIAAAGWAARRGYRQLRED